MLYLNVFAGFPASGLHAGGLQYAFCACSECCKDRGGEPPEVPLLLEHDENIQVRKEGVFTPDSPGDEGEFLYDIEYRMSDVLVQQGITWKWFLPNFSFGNGLSTFQSWASPEFHKVVNGTPLSLEDYLLEIAGRNFFRRLWANLTLKMTLWHNRHSSWEKYESRWLPGTCPQEPHLVHLTWLVTAHRLPEFVYERIRDIIEYGAEPNSLERYSLEPGKHFSEILPWNGQPFFRKI